MSDNIDLMAFVSDNGHVIGIGRANPDTMKPDTGMIVAVLEKQVTLVEWLDALNGSRDLLQAVKRMLAQYGGEPLAKIISMEGSTFLPLMSTQVGEA